MDIFNWAFWKRALIRALHTFCQTALGMITVGMAIKDVDWLHILSVGAVAAVISILKSVVVGVPETDQMVIQLTPETLNDWDDEELSVEEDNSKQE